MRLGVCLCHIPGILNCFLQYIEMTQALIRSKVILFTQNPHFAITVECYCKVWILSKNCDLRIRKYLRHFDVLQRTIKNHLKMA
jgi:hypothetical protein